MEMKYILDKLLEKEHLTHTEMRDVFTEMMKGVVSEPQIAAFLTALSKSP